MKNAIQYKLSNKAQNRIKKLKIKMKNYKLKWKNINWNEKRGEQNLLILLKIGTAYFK